MPGSRKSVSALQKVLPEGAGSVLSSVAVGIGIGSATDICDDTLTVTLSETELWPPNHTLVDVVATIDVSDVCKAEDGSGNKTLAQVTIFVPHDTKL